MCRQPKGWCHRYCSWLNIICPLSIPIFTCFSPGLYCHVAYCLTCRSQIHLRFSSDDLGTNFIESLWVSLQAPLINPLRLLAWAPADNYFVLVTAEQLRTKWCTNGLQCTIYVSPLFVVDSKQMKSTIPRFSLHQPHTSRLVVHANQTMFNILYAFVNAEYSNWYAFIPYAAFALNSMKQDALKDCKSCGNKQFHLCCHCLPLNVRQL